MSTKEKVIAGLRQLLEYAKTAPESEREEILKQLENIQARLMG